MDAPQKTRKLGKTDLELTPVGLGTWQFSKRKNLAGKFWPTLSDEDSFEIVKQSYKQGINWFDTAELYGSGESERTLVRALKNASISDDEVYIATKWSPIFRTARSIVRTIDKRRKALSGYTISLHQVHNPMSFSSVTKEMNAMARLVREQKIRYVGVSNFSANQMRKAHEVLSRHGLVLASNQVQYNLLQRKIERNEIMKTAKELGIAIIAYSPLAQGILTGKYHEHPEMIQSRKGFRKNMPAFRKKGLEKTQPLIKVLNTIAQKYNVTAAQVALNWLIHFHGEQVFVIPGASNTRQAAGNAQAMNFRLSQEEMDQLDMESQKIQ